MPSSFKAGKDKKAITGFQGRRVGLLVFLWVWQRGGGSWTLPMGTQDRDECQWVNFDTSFTSSIQTHTHTNWEMSISNVERTEEYESRGVKERTPLTKLTGQLTVIDKGKQWNHVQTPTLLKDNTRVSHPCHTHSPPFLRHNVRSCQTLAFINNVSLFLFHPLSLSLRNNGRVSQTSWAELAVASSPCQEKQS